MAVIGWKGEPSAGFSHKEDVGGNVVARAHDATWWADYRAEQARAERTLAREEQEERERAAGLPRPGA
jgi:hypothetical protein